MSRGQAQRRRGPGAAAFVMATIACFACAESGGESGAGGLASGGAVEGQGGSGAVGGPGGGPGGADSSLGGAGSGSGGAGSSSGGADRGLGGASGGSGAPGGGSGGPSSGPGSAGGDPGGPGPGGGGSAVGGSGGSNADPGCAPLTACDGLCVDLTADPRNCGRCGRTCVLANAEPGCVAGECAIAACEPDFFDRDGDPGTGCEVESACVPDAPCATDCGGTGRLVCSGAAPACVATDICNATDDNCDGQCDEGALAGCRVPVHRGLGDGHIYSTDLGQVQNDVFHVEALAFFHLYVAPFGGMRPVFLCRKPNGKRFLTSENACEIGVGPERTLGFWAPGPVCGATALFRLYSEAAGDHFYSISPEERDAAIARFGYRDEGVAGWVWLSP